MAQNGMDEYIRQVKERLNIPDNLPESEGASAEEAEPRCSICDDIGYVSVGGRSQPCACSESKLARRFLERSGLLEREWSWMPNFAWDLPGKRGLAQIYSALGEPPTGIYSLHGAPGVGKSGFMKACVARTCMGHLAPAYYTLAEGMLDYVRATYSDHAPERTEDAINRLRKYQLLAIDEIDRVSNTEWAQGKLMNILNDRYERRDSVATILASNTPVEKLPTYLGSRLLDGYVIVVGGAVLRGRQ